MQMLFFKHLSIITFSTLPLVVPICLPQHPSIITSFTLPLVVPTCLPLNYGIHGIFLFF